MATNGCVRPVRSGPEGKEASMEYQGFWDSIVSNISGRGLLGGSFQIRLVLQPLLAMLLGARVGIKDAKHGDLPFFQTLLHEKGHRGDLLFKALRDAIVP